MILRLSGVSVRRSGRTLLGPLDWSIESGDRWVVIGPNGSGKTTLVHVASTYLWPTRGSVEVLGETIGRVDARELRRRVGYAGAGLEGAIDPALSALDVVVTARHAALGPWWHTFTDADRARARDLLAAIGVGDLAERAFGQLSTGERRRVQIARALMPDPELLILDEPGASLDLGAREALVRDLGAPGRGTDAPRGRPRHPSRRGDPGRLRARTRAFGWARGRGRADRRHADRSRDQRGVRPADQHRAHERSIPGLAGRSPRMRAVMQTSPTGWTMSP